ncbi:MAG: DegT/DnrJ/EryC1/StrS family aminotransferase [Acidobacteria bacterium]|nr:DegT/DnrJ/EryC1/StrS family aminotransferase [Acidobacteriota bacterium]
MIPFLDLQREYQNIQAELEPVVQRVLASGQYILGDEVRVFELRWAKYCGVRYGAMVASGTDGLTLALEASEAIHSGAGDEVITAAHGSPYTALAILRAGARPVFADIDAKTWLASPETIEPAITPRTRAIIPVHLYGLVSDMAGIMRLARDRNLVVIEDACQAHGARFQDRGQWRKAGSLGDAAAFSFYPTKNLGCFGDAGFIATDDEEWMNRARMLAQGGQHERDHTLSAGHNSRGDELQAAILNCKLAHLDEWNDRRRKLAGLYRQRLKLPGICFQQVPEAVEPVYHLFVVRHPQRDALRAYLRERGIEALIHYPEAVHLQPAFLQPGQPALAEAERVAAEVLSLPLHPCLSDTQAEEVADTINEFAAVRV